MSILGNHLISTTSKLRFRQGSRPSARSRSDAEPGLGVQQQDNGHHGVGANALPSVDFSAMAAALGVRSKRIACADDLLALSVEELFAEDGPILLDVLVDPDEVPPIGVRVKTLQEG